MTPLKFGLIGRRKAYLFRIWNIRAINLHAADLYKVNLEWATSCSNINVVNEPHPLDLRKMFMCFAKAVAYYNLWDMAWYPSFKRWKLGPMALFYFIGVNISISMTQCVPGWVPMLYNRVPSDSKPRFVYIIGTRPGTHWEFILLKNSVSFFLLVNWLLVIACHLLTTINK